MKIVIMAVGRTATDYIRSATDEYLKRASRYMPVEFMIVPDIKASRALDETSQKEREGMKIIEALQPGDRVVLLDEHGRQMTSREFAGFIERGALAGLKRLVFIIGGPYGFSDEVHRRADSEISLSRMTFSHEMIRLFFTEQIYRAMTILRGEPYHHD